MKTPIILPDRIGRLVLMTMLTKPNGPCSRVDETEKSSYFV